MSTLRVVSVSVKDVLGAREFGIEPGRINTIKGRNGSGKSTALQAIQSALGGGNLAKLARVGAPGEKVEPEVVLLIEGEGTEAYRVERKGATVRVRERVRDTAAFQDVGKPQTWLRSLYDPDGANPVSFLMAKDDDRATMLLEALPLNYTRAALVAAMGIADADLPQLPAEGNLHPLEEIALIRDAVFRQRTGVNRDEKTKRAAAEQVRLKAPAVPPDDPGGEAHAALEAEAITLAAEIAREERHAEAAEAEAIEAARATYAQAEAAATGAFKREAAKLRADHEANAAELRATVERQIATLAAAMEQSIEERRADAEAALDDATARRDGAVAEANAAREKARHAQRIQRGDLAAKREELAVIRERREASAKAVALLEQAKQFDAEADELAGEAGRLTDALDALDAFRRGLAEGLPIPGLEVEGKAITVNGIPYEQLNTAQKVDIAVQVAVIRAKGSRLPVLFVDGAEALDTEHFEHLVARLKAEGVQAFIGRVSDSDLEVVREEAATA